MLYHSWKQLNVFHNIRVIRSNNMDSEKTIDISNESVKDQSTGNSENIENSENASSNPAESSDNPPNVDETTNECNEKIAYNVMLGDEKKHTVYDLESCAIETDDECMIILESLKETLVLDQSGEDLLNLCIDVIKSEDDTEVAFSPFEFVQLALLAERHPESAHKILLCSNYIIELLDFQGEMPKDIFLTMATLHMSMNSIVDSDDESESYDSDNDNPPSDTVGNEL